MAFGQQSGPPATGRQLRELETLLGAAGYSSFREARGPLGFTQRQGGGKFTAAEADALIERLQAEAEGGEPPPPDRTAPPARRPAAAPARATSAASRQQRAERHVATAKGLPPHVMAAELEAQGWIIVPPEGYEPPPA